MNIWELDKLILFLIIFIPGFVSIKIYDLLIPGEKRDFTKSLFEVLGYSAFNFAALSWLIILINSENFYSLHKNWYYISIIFILFISPTLWPIIILKLRKWRLIAKYTYHPLKKPWDYVFGKRESYWIIVHLKNGQKIGGKFDTESFASSFPAEEQIYLEEVWVVDKEGIFKKPIDRSKGIIILASEILAVEFFK